MAQSDQLVATSVGYKGSATKVRIAQRNKYYQLVALITGIVLVSRPLSLICELILNLFAYLCLACRFDNSVFDLRIHFQEVWQQLMT